MPVQGRIITINFCTVCVKHDLTSQDFTIDCRHHCYVFGGFPFQISDWIPTILAQMFHRFPQPFSASAYMMPQIRSLFQNAHTGSESQPAPSFFIHGGGGLFPESKRQGREAVSALVPLPRVRSVVIRTLRLWSSWQ